jgi:DNA polymerase epsilon subunit 1
VVCPDKHSAPHEKFDRGHLLESETYIGGKVEALESGVFRADIPLKFKCHPEGYQYLVDQLDEDLRHAIVEENGLRVEDITNYAEVRADIERRLTDVRDRPDREEESLLYHLDVSAMYPNIILTNRLQPSAIVTDVDCASCDHNHPDKKCLRKMEWVWRGEHYSGNRAEYLSIKSQLDVEVFKHPETGERVDFSELSLDDQRKRTKDRFKSYCQKVYKRVLTKPVEETRTAGICMKENAFYIDTVRAFRDRRYVYKRLTKEWSGKLETARETQGVGSLAAKEAADMVVLYESLQLAHKCILNSFYGYVMRKGARWYSMEMAGVVTHTGANIISMANRLCTKLGRPLELDTDGIWVALPGTFPGDYKLTTSTGKSAKISYPCAMLNRMTAQMNTNDQVQTRTRT